MTRDWDNGPTRTIEGQSPFACDPREYRTGERLADRGITLNDGLPNQAEAYEQGRRSDRGKEGEGQNKLSSLFCPGLNQ